MFMDIVGWQGSLNTSETGPILMLTKIDSFSILAEAIPIYNQSAKTVARVLFEQWISRFGVPNGSPI